MYNVLKAAGNAFNRFESGAGNMSIGSRVKYAMTPQRAMAAELDNTNSIANRYGTAPIKKPDGGYDYYVNGNKASLQDYINAGGVVPADEPSTGASQVDLGGNDFESGVRGYGNGGNTAPVYGTTTMNGQVYDLDNPNDRARFLNDKLGILTAMRDEEIAKGKRTSDQQLAQIDQEINDTYAAAKTYVEDYKKNVDEFGNQYQLGNVKRQQYFAGLSPNAFQSSQGTSQEYATGKYLQGLGDYAKEAQSNVGEGFIANPNDMSNLAGNSIYGRQVSGLRGEQQSVANAFNDYVKSQNDWLGGQKDTLSNSFGKQDQYSFAKKELAPVTANKADVSAYTPYTTFQSGNTQMPVSQPTNNVYTQNAFTAQTPLDSFLGRNVVTGKQKDYIQQYLLGKA